MEMGIVGVFVRIVVIVDDIIVIAVVVAVDDVGVRRIAYNPNQKPPRAFRIAHPL